MSRQNQMFSKMFEAAREALEARPPEEAARAAGVEYDPARRTFAFPTLGEAVELTLPDCAFSPALPEWHALVALHYLANADGAPAGAGWIPMGRLRDGMVRGAKCDREAGARIGALLGRRTPAEAEAACLALGGKIERGTADLTAALPFLPRCPMLLNLWFADDEFDGSARLLVDRAADHYLSVEDAVTAGDVLIARLSAAVSRL